MPEGLGNLIGANGGVKWGTIHKVGERIQQYYQLTEANYMDVMRQYGRKRGCVEFEYLMVVFNRLVRYYGMARAIRMLSEILASLAEGGLRLRTRLPRTSYRNRTTATKTTMT